MTDQSAETADMPKGWPPPEPPVNTPWDQVEYGVFCDRRDRGLGVGLVQVSTDPVRALDEARLLDGKGHVRIRRVMYSPWSGPIYDDRPVVFSPGGRA